MNQAAHEWPISATPSVVTGSGASYSSIVTPRPRSSSIATRMYGDPNQYLKIYEANRSILKDPNALAPGMILVIPR